MADYDLFRESERESVDALWCLTALPRGTVALFFSAPRLDDRQSVRNPAGGGRSIERAAAGTFIPASTELGAKDPGYVRADADLAAAVDTLMDGAMFNSGQSCCGIERIYVQEPLFDAFVEMGRRLGERAEPRQPARN